MGNDDQGEPVQSLNRPQTAAWKRAEQLKLWESSSTNRESAAVKSCGIPRSVRFPDSCVFLAACASGDKDEVSRLLRRNANIDTRNVDGLTALHQAVIDENIEMVHYLIEQGANIDAMDNEGWTPLHAAVSCGFLDIARLLVECGSNIAAVNNDGELPIDLSESEDVSNFLALEMDRQGIDLEFSRRFEEHIMLQDAMHWLQSKTFRDRRHPQTGATALHVAAAKGYIKVLNILIQAGADVNAQDYDGWSPLHASAHWGEKHASEILVECMADMQKKNYAGQTPFDVCDDDMVEFLKDLKNRQSEMIQARPIIENILDQNIAKPYNQRKNSITRMSTNTKHSVTKVDEVKEGAVLRSTSSSESSDSELSDEPKLDLSHHVHEEPVKDVPSPQSQIEETGVLLPPRASGGLHVHQSKASGKVDEPGLDFYPKVPKLENTKDKGDEHGSSALLPDKAVQFRPLSQTPTNIEPSVSCMSQEDSIIHVATQASPSEEERGVLLGYKRPTSVPKLPPGGKTAVVMVKQLPPEKPPRLFEANTRASSVEQHQSPVSRANITQVPHQDAASQSFSTGLPVIWRDGAAPDSSPAQPGPTSRSHSSPTILTSSATPFSARSTRTSLARSPAPSVSTPSAVVSASVTSSGPSIAEAVRWRKPPESHLQSTPRATTTSVSSVTNRKVAQFPDFGSYPKPLFAAAAISPSQIVASCTNDESSAISSSQESFTCSPPVPVSVSDSWKTPNLRPTPPPWSSLRHTPMVFANSGSSFSIQEKSPTLDSITNAKRQFSSPKRDEASEAERKAHARRQRESRRSTQGITPDMARAAAGSHDDHPQMKLAPSTHIVSAKIASNDENNLSDKNASGDSSGVHPYHSSQLSSPTPAETKVEDEERSQSLYPWRHRNSDRKSRQYSRSSAGVLPLSPTVGSASPFASAHAISSQHSALGPTEVPITTRSERSSRTASLIENKSLPQSNDYNSSQHPPPGMAKSRNDDKSPRGENGSHEKSHIAARRRSRQERRPTGPVNELAESNESNEEAPEVGVLLIRDSAMYVPGSPCRESQVNPTDHAEESPVRDETKGQEEEEGILLLGSKVSRYRYSPGLDEDD